MRAAGLVGAVIGAAWGLLFWTVSSNAASLALHVVFGAMCGLVGEIVLGFLIRRHRCRPTSGL
jgi:hypothetical protein